MQEMDHEDHEDHDSTDPWLWLEDVDSDEALDWVRARNVETESELAGLPGYAALRARLKTILDSRDRIPYVGHHDGRYYNFWRDADHERGIWRRTTLDEYRKPAPDWETVLDLDALAREESENWVWAGVSFLEPHGTRCLVSLSRGGGDAHVVREFDVATRAFVAGGFELPEAKTTAGWMAHDTLFVATDFGPGSMTASGYPRIARPGAAARRWHRRRSCTRSGRTTCRCPPGRTRRPATSASSCNARSISTRASCSCAIRPMAG